MQTADDEDQRALHTFYDDDGMLVIQGLLAPEAGAMFAKALDAAAAQMRDKAPDFTYEQRQADALVELAGASLGGDSDSGLLGGRYQVVVHVDANVAPVPRSASASAAAATLARGNASAGIHIDAVTAYPRWDGEPVDYEYVAAVMQHSGVV